MSRQAARTARKKLLAIGLDPDVPLDVYEVLHAQSFSWDMSRDDRKRYNLARAAGDMKTVNKLQKRSRESSMAGVAHVRELLAPMLKAAHTPAISINASRK